MIQTPYSRAAAATSLLQYRRSRRYLGGGRPNPAFNLEMSKLALAAVSERTPCPLWLYLADESITDLVIRRTATAPGGRA